MVLISLILGLCVLINFIFIVAKFKKQRYLDAWVDIGLIFIVMAMYGSSIVGGAVATIGSTFISIYLYIYPLINKNSEWNELSVKEFWDKLEDTI